jgi:hypothetical protein
MLTGKLFSPMFIFKFKMENCHNWTEYAKNEPQLHHKQCLIVSICHMVKIDLRTLESNCNWNNYLADSRFVPPIDRLTFPPIQYVGGTTSAIKMVVRQFLSRPQFSQRSISRDENARKAGSTLVLARFIAIVGKCDVICRLCWQIGLKGVNKYVDLLPEFRDRIHFSNLSDICNCSVGARVVKEGGAVLCVPRVITVGPGQHRGKTGEHVVEGPAEDHIVVAV